MNTLQAMVHRRQKTEALRRVREYYTSNHLPPELHADRVTLEKAAIRMVKRIDMENNHGPSHS